VAESHERRRNGWQALLARWRGPEPHTLVLLFLASAAAWVFLRLGAQILTGENHALDEALLLALRSAADPAVPLGPRWLHELARDITALGSNAILLLAGLAVTGFLALQHRWRAALLVVLAVGGGVLLGTLLKLGYDRPRPELVPHAVQVYTASFPSGHALGAAVTYLTFGAILAAASPQRRVKIYCLTLAVSLALLVGASRVYLGVHWPSDVLAGWAAGAAWALLCWALVQWRRG
jgi:undecaprenyl-diphosphatase